MAASDTELFFELTNSVFVQSVEAPNQIAAPVLYADDLKPILLKFLRRISPTEVEVVGLTGVTAQMAIGTPAGTPTVITSATSGIVDANGFLPISLPLNIAAVQTALGTSREIQSTVEFRVIFGSNPQRFQTTITVRQRLITGTLADPAPPAVALSLEEANSLFVPRDGSGSGGAPICASFLMVDEDNTTLVYRVVLRAGELHVAPLQ